MSVECEDGFVIVNLLYHLLHMKAILKKKKKEKDGGA